MKSRPSALMPLQAAAAPRWTSSASSARQLAERSRVEGTPSLIIGGKYLVPVDERGDDHRLRTAGALVAQRQAISK